MHQLLHLSFSMNHDVLHLPVDVARKPLGWGHLPLGQSQGCH